MLGCLAKLNKACANACMPMVATLEVISFIGPDSPIYTFKCSHKSLTMARAHIQTHHFPLGALVKSQKRITCVVVGHCATVVPEHVARSILVDRHFSNGCWVALRLFHRGSRLDASEARAESWCSDLQYLWDAQQGLSSGGMIQRLTIKAAGVKANSCDDALVDRIADYLGMSITPHESTLRKNQNERQKYTTLDSTALGDGTEALWHHCHRCINTNSQEYQ